MVKWIKKNWWIALALILLVVLNNWYESYHQETLDNAEKFIDDQIREKEEKKDN